MVSLTEEEKRASMKFKCIGEISENQLRRIWNEKFSDKPFPKVNAFLLENSEFFRVYHQQLKVPWATDMRETEYGEKVPDEEIFGFVVGVYEQSQNEPEMGFFILVRPLPTDKMNFILEHELRHIYSGEIKKW